MSVDVYDLLNNRMEFLVIQRNKILDSPIKYYLDKFFFKNLKVIDLEIDAIDYQMSLLIKEKILECKNRDACPCGGE